MYVPRFCYHNRMQPVGMCRQCLVEVEGPRGPMLIVSCMTPVAANQVVHTDSPTVKKAQEGVLEFLLANHPLDCPVCDKGGECPLQDQAFSHGPGESRFIEEKRHFEKPIPISSLVYLDRERCILCDRCTRFASEVAGDPLISFTHRGNNTQVLTFPDDPFASYFSGNTVQICPVGALTAKPYRFRARPWDLEQTESTCTTCAVGCRITVQSSQNILLRYQGVDSDPVNWGWLCDKGRFGFEATASPDRVTTPLARQDGELTPVTWGAALAAAADAVRSAIDAGGPGAVAIVGGARGTNEDAFAWALLAREVIGTANLDAQLDDGLPPAVFNLPGATIDEACAASTIVLLGPDLKEELPVLYLRVRDAAQSRRSRILELGSKDTGLTPYAWRSVRHEPGEQLAAVRRILDDAEVAQQLGAGSVVVVVGRANLAESEHHTLDALAALLAAVPAARVLPVLRRGNVRGAIAAGLTPGEGGLDTPGIMAAAAEGKVRCLVLLGRRPAVRPARRRAGRQGAGRRGDGHRRRHPPDAVVPPGPPRPPRRGAGREGRHHHEPGGPGHRAVPEDHPARLGPTGLGHRHRPGDGDGGRGGHGLGRGASRAAGGHRARVRPGDRRGAGRGPRRRAPRPRDPAVARRRRRSGARAPQLVRPAPPGQPQPLRRRDHGRVLAVAGPTGAR